MAPVPTVESAKLKSGDLGEIFRSPVDIGGNAWAYDRLKRSTEKARFEVDCSGRPEALAASEYDKFVVQVKRDSLLLCSVLAFEDKAYSVTFRNGSVVTFKPPQKQ